ncbi:MAG: T9SS type A sorting domain-containing protein [Bacteroidota bacterium]|nr:T9SS type A sorting domain-containing protein [Bacteroidota bacterium]
MKKIKLLSLLIIITSASLAQTNVNGEQTGIWYASNSPYLVTGDLIVPANQTLTIESGVTVNFQGHYKMTVTGKLEAIGTISDTIYFTTDNHTEGWGGIVFDEATDISSMSFCKFEYGKTLSSDEYPDMHGGAVKLITSNMVCSNCVFSNNSSLPSEGMGGAIYAINTGDIAGETLTTITDCKFVNNECYSEGGAIKFTSDGYTEITNCEFIENNCNYGGGAISGYGVVGTKMTKCLFENNYTMYSNGGAIHMLGYGNTMFFENCTITENEAATGDGGGVYIVNGVIDFVNCIVYNNSAAYGGVQGDNIYVSPDGSTATINYCNVIMPEYGSSGSNNINEDPLFVNAANGDFHLQETSPCIDAGTDIGLPFIGDAPDMGCFEFEEPNSINKVFFTENFIYPNPTSGILNFEFANTNIQKLTISDITGKQIIEKENIQQNETIDLSSFVNGIYIIKTQTDKEILTTKIVKE